ncbi:CDP-diacylglycerol--serine O-phosphatidyltransferase [bacterium]|nr:CDP-diacylglycerol--serine O-phosphatidyltransferase [bacterium]
MRRKLDSQKNLDNLRPVVPGVFTFGNLLCGFLAILHAMGDNPINAAWFILIGAFLDALDGKVARLAKGATPLGVQLDSLADFLTFGIAPIIMMFGVGCFDLRDWRLAIGLLYLFAGAYRLARFNLEAVPEGVDNFTGLPIPAAALTVASGVLFIQKVWPPIVGNGSLGGVAIMAWLMVSNVPYPKRLPRFKLSRQKSIVFVIPILILILGLILAPVYLIYPMMIIYVAFGLARAVFNSLTHRKERLDEKFQSNGECSKEGDGGGSGGEDY